MSLIIIRSLLPRSPPEDVKLEARPRDSLGSDIRQRAGSACSDKLQIGDSMLKLTIAQYILSLAHRLNTILLPSEIRKGIFTSPVSGVGIMERKGWMLKQCSHSRFNYVQAGERQIQIREEFRVDTVDTQRISVLTTHTQ
jgi:hypothetical protein